MIRVSTKSLGEIEFTGAHEVVQRGDLAVAIEYRTGPLAVVEIGGVPMAELLAWRFEVDPA